MRVTTRDPQSISRKKITSVGTSNDSRPSYFTREFGGGGGGSDEKDILGLAFYYPLFVAYLICRWILDWIMGQGWQTRLEDITRLDHFRKYSGVSVEKDL